MYITWGGRSTLDNPSKNYAFGKKAYFFVPNRRFFFKIFCVIFQKIKEEKEDIGLGHNCLGNEGAEILIALSGFGGNTASFTNMNNGTIPHGPVTAEILVQPAVNRLRFRYVN